MINCDKKLKGGGSWKSDITLFTLKCMSKSAIFWLNEEYLCKNCLFFLTDINFGCALRAILDKLLNFWTVWGRKTFFADTLTLNRIICYILLGSGVSWAFLMWFFKFFVCFVGLIEFCDTARSSQILFNSYNDFSLFWFIY